MSGMELSLFSRDVIAMSAGVGLTHDAFDAALMLGGCDSEGREVFNELTRMFLQAYRELGTIYPKPYCRYSKSSSSEYLRHLPFGLVSALNVSLRSSIWPEQ